MNKHAEKLREESIGRGDWMSEAADEIDRLESLPKVRHIHGDTLAGLLIKYGIVQECAVFDSEGYDGGKTEDAINRIASELNIL